MEINWHIPLFTWPMLIPVAVVVCVGVFVIRCRRHWPAVLAIVSLAAFAGTAALFPLSWETNHDAIIWHNYHLPSMNVHYWELHLESRHGGVCLTFRTLDGPDNPEPGTTGPVFIAVRRARWGTNYGSYPMEGWYSLIKSKFIKNSLGFQLCWGSGSDTLGYPQAIYSVTLTHWFILAFLCPIFPLFWLRRRLRERRARGFPVEAHPTPAPSAPKPPS